ncbi:MAG: efflux RND transporter periplasmic adaptor subunit [Planctomycetota bacterium]
MPEPDETPDHPEPEEAAPPAEPTPASRQPDAAHARPQVAPPPSAITRFVAVGLIVAAAVGVGIWASSSGGAPRADATQQGPGHATPVDVVVIRHEDVPYEPRFLGRTDSSHSVEVRSRVSGYLTERSFEEGAVVQPGQTLFQIDARPFENELRQAQAQLAAAEANRERATQQLQRYEVLSSKQAATQGELEEWQKQERVAAAEVELQKVRIDAAQLQLDYATIESPIQGVIGEALLDVGTHVSGPTALLAKIERLDPLYVRYALTESELLRLQRQREANELAMPGFEQLELEVTLADGRTHPFRGKIDFVEPELQQAVGTTLVRGVIPNPERDLRPGQFVHVTVKGMRLLRVVRVPQAAVLHSPTGASVYVVSPENTVAVRPVTLGDWQGEGQWVIQDGLEPGDQVIVNRLLTLRPGAPVTPTEVSPQEAQAETAAPSGGGSSSGVGNGGSAFGAGAPKDDGSGGGGSSGGARGNGGH